MSNQPAKSDNYSDCPVSEQSFAGFDLKAKENPADGPQPEDRSAQIVYAVQAAIPLAAKWISNAQALLCTVRRSLSGDTAMDIRAMIGLPIVRRHFHTDRNDGRFSEAEAVESVEQIYGLIDRFLRHPATVFLTADDAEAAENTRGIYGSGVNVAAYGYARRSVSFTPGFLSLGPNCQAAVIIHQLAIFVDPKMRDNGCGILEVESSDFATALYNMHAYPNFAVNATPPYIDERFGMQRPEF